MARRELSIGAHELFQQIAQVPRLENLAAVKWVDDDARRAVSGTQQKMTWKRQAGDIAAAGAGGMDIEYANADRQPGTVINYVQQIGIFRIVVGIDVALIAMCFEYQPVNRRRASLQEVVIVGGFPRFRREV